MTLTHTRLASSASFAALLIAASWSGPVWAATPPPQAARQADRPVAVRPGTTQAQAQADEAVSEVEEVVVTGTLIRGVAPVGTNVIGIDKEDIVATGAASANDLLATIPQIASFNTLPQGLGGGNGSPIVRPNIRGIGGGGASTTLTLLNGLRIVGAGILQTVPDPSIIPPGVVDRVEVIPDGGSSIYGSSAIGGVINFITRRRADGLSIDARYGVADDYEARDLNVTAGRSWDGGSAYLSYSHAEHTNLSKADRDYASMYRPDYGGADFRSSACAPGNILIANVPYALPDRVRSTRNLCDVNEGADLYPEESRNSLFAAYTQSLSDQLEFRLDGYYSIRNTTTRGSQPTTQGVIRSTNPYFRPVGVETQQTVAFGYTNLFGPSTISEQEFASYGLTPTLTYDLNDNWRVRGLLNLGRSDNEVREDSLNALAITAALAGTTLATALNPYSPSASASSVLSSIEDYAINSYATQELAQARLVVDGSLFTLPGGDAKLAVGVEFSSESLSPRVVTGPRSAPLSDVSSDVSRDISSVFGELLIPVFGEANGRLGLRSFDLTVSGRYDEYSDFGGTFNPKVGFRYVPWTGLAVRGNYGTSFNAPSLADSASTVDTRAPVLFTSFARSSNSVPADANRATILITGSNPNLKPEEADTHSIGVDWQPDFIPGLTASLTYFYVNFTNAIGITPVTGAAITDPAYAGYYIENPTLAQLQARIGNARLDGVGSLEELYANGQSPYLFQDARRSNLGELELDGLDFSVNYRRSMSFGALSGGISGTYTLSRDAKVNPLAPAVDNLANGTRELGLVANLGAEIGGFRARAVYNYAGGYPVLGNAVSTEAKAFETVDLFFSQDFGDRWGLDGLVATLNIDNVFDQDPPFFSSNQGFANGQTLGRFVSVGLRKSF